MPQPGFPLLLNLRMALWTDNIDNYGSYITFSLLLKNKDYMMHEGQMSNVCSSNPLCQVKRGPLETRTCLF